MSRPNPQLTPGQQDLLLAALASNSKPGQQSSAGARAGSRDSMSDKGGKTGRFDPNTQSTPPSGHFDFGSDDSPYLGFDIDGEGDESYDFDVNGQMIGDLPEPAADLHDKRKSIDGKDDDEGGGKRRESEDKSGKKPGRKPLTSEPTTVSISCGFGGGDTSDYECRNVRHRIALLNGHSENGKRSISKTSKSRSTTSRRLPSLQTMRTDFSEHKWRDYKSN